ncbi:MAG: FMN-dependent NADH-azoreductase [Alphaproteobacteria bacterium MarineAlpha11_Bin1]|nr:MAG: FMN-dependent NADH-azoreductase [Alphaproteobacteria bacterium MarineAlpha11_Bin1]
MTEPVCLLVSCHPLKDSLCHHLVDRVEVGLKAQGIVYEHLDLYADEFNASLTVAERESYFTDDFNDSEVADQIAQLLRAKTLILVFPTWWFNVPARLKGWFDRVWGPRIAFTHTPDKRTIMPALEGLNHCLVVTTLASRWWVNHLLLRHPVKRFIKGVMLRGCAPQASYEMLSFYDAIGADEGRVDTFRKLIDQAIRKIGSH